MTQPRDPAGALKRALDAMKANQEAAQQAAADVAAQRRQEADDQAAADQEATP